MEVDMRIAIRLLLMLAITVTSQSQNGTPITEKSIVFAQFTDAHIFDDGWKAKGSEPYWDAIDNRTALHWAIESINSLAIETSIDFVIYTGDFGLQNVFFTAPECNGVAFKSEPGIPPFSSEMATEELALELNRLAVRTIYVIPGNNDIIDEQVQDGARFECFVVQLQVQLNRFPHPVHIEPLRADSAVHEHGLRLFGLNSASFKNADHNYKSKCLPPSLPPFAITL